MKVATTSAVLFMAGSYAQSLQSLLGTPGLTQLTAVLKKYPAIAQTLSAAKDITILAPADGAKGLSALAASSDLLDRVSPGAVEATLTYHVLKGAIASTAIPPKAFVETLLTSANYSSVTGGQKVEVEKTAQGVTFTSAGGAKSKVSKADIKFDGGYIHLIDAVLQPPQNVAKTALGGGLTTLARKLSEEDLIQTVEGLKDITIFAPTNGAFTKAASVVNSLNTAQLKGALTYHVAKGVGFSTDLKNGQQIPTVNGKPLTVKIEGGNVFINNAKVVKADVLTKNGVVHFIDSVLVPPA